ncbi:phosphate ABC transporter substrate-binding protein PstS [Polymorphospora sp. A560]
MKRRGRLAGAVLAILVAVTTPAAPAFAVPYEQVEGTGSTWSANALQQWVTGVQTTGNRVVYTANGSSAGRRDFSNFQSDFGVSEIPYQTRPDPVTGVVEEARREFAYMPIVAGGTSFMYHIEVGGRLYRDLRLSGETIVGIFTNRITKWNDPAITRDNNGRALPAIDIVPVVRSDGSGTTAQFSLWMDKQHQRQWRDYCGCQGLTSYYPRKGRQVAQSGSDNVANYVAAGSGNGTIGYVEFSYARNKNYPVAKMLNRAGYYVAPTDHNVAVALQEARINTDRSNPREYLTQVLDGVYASSDRRAYPLSSYSYMILPVDVNDRRMTPGRARALADYAYYSICEGQRNAGQLGYSPLPRNLVQAGFDQIGRIAKLSAEDRTDKDFANCPNPTFDPRNPGVNKLAREAPNPPECDRQGQGPCGAAGGGPRPTGTATPPPGGGTPSGGVPSAGASPSAGAPPVDLDGDGIADVDPETGQPILAGGSETDLVGSATEVAAFRQDGTSRWLPLLAAGLVLLVVLLPALVTRSLARRPEPRR